MSRVATSSEKFVKLKHKGNSIYAYNAESFTTIDTAIDNLEYAVDAICSENIDYFLVPGFTLKRYRVAIFENDRQRVINLLLDYAINHPHLYILWKYKGDTKIAPLDKKILHTTVIHVNTIRIFKYVAAPNGRILASDEFGCDMEFWLTGDELARRKDKILNNLKLGLYEGYDFQNCWAAQRQNKFGGIIPKECQKKIIVNVRNREYVTLEVFNKTHVSDVNFPIDVVYTWVDDSDEKWIAQFNKYRKIIGGNLKNNSASRYANRDELKYSLRSLYMYGSSFVRNIYIVTNGQIPKWLNTKHPQIHVIHHKDIFADEKALPTFSSRAISSQLHHIPGLSDYYLYFNDDVFLGRHVDAQQFFYPSGIMKILPSQAQIGLGKPSVYESSPSSAGKNVRSLLDETFNIFITNKFRHAPYPQNKKLLQEISKKYSDAVDKTMFSRFRHPDDIELSGTFQYSYALIKGKAVEGDYPSTTIDVSLKDSKKLLDDTLKSRRYDVICLNESDTPDKLKKQTDENVRRFMQAYYPIPSPYEVDEKR